jgi:cold shock CspA family protein
MTAIVTQIFPEEGYGFIKTLDGQEVYFHQNSVLHGDFDRLELGTGVRFIMTQGDKGPQATTVQVVNKPGARASKTDAIESDEVDVEAPQGWQ